MQQFNLQKTNIMGIINLTRNSFVSTGKFQSVDAAVDYALQLEAQGADIIDVGAEATNPGTSPIISLKQELQLITPFIQALRQQSKIPISVDTSKPQVMQAAIDNGADIINDVRALRLPGAVEMVAKLKVPVILMHMEYPFGITDAKPEIINITQHVINFLLSRVDVCLAGGILNQNIILDISVGAGNFGKTAEQSIELIQKTNEFVSLGYPVLAGVSYKAFIGDLFDIPVEERSIPSLAAILFCASKGAKILRVHEVLKTRQALDMMTLIKKM